MNRDTRPDGSLRTSLRPGDAARIAARHGAIYAREHGFDATFETYVAEPLETFVRTRTARERLWQAERDGELIGCIAIVAATPQTAQLRWFLVDPSARGAGLGRRLLAEAVQFSRDNGYETILLWTVSRLTAAARLYQEFGFKLVEERPGIVWGVAEVEQRYEMRC